jgi:hypothetical protein
MGFPNVAENVERFTVLVGCWEWDGGMKRLFAIGLSLLMLVGFTIDIAARSE